LKISYYLKSELKLQLYFFQKKMDINLVVTPRIIKVIIEYAITTNNCSNDFILWINNRLKVIPKAIPISKVGQNEKLIRTFSLNE